MTIDLLCDNIQMSIYPIYMGFPHTPEHPSYGNETLPKPQPKEVPDPPEEKQDEGD